MKRSILFIPVFFFVFFTTAQTTIEDSTEVSGTWILASSPYLINGEAIVAEGDSLIIDPGVVLKFKVDSGFLDVEGKLIAKGTSEQPILFTRQGEEGYWGCIKLSSTEVNSILDYCKIQFASSYGIYGGAIYIFNPTTKLSNSIIINNKSDGIVAIKSTPEIRNCIIGYNGRYGILLKDEYRGTIKIINSSILGNENDGLYTNGARCQVVNCIFLGNSKSLNLHGDRTYISYSHIGLVYDLSDMLVTGEGMIYNFDPRLNSDFSLSNNSPCINAGTIDTSGLQLPALDIAGNNRINLGRVDMGAVESTADKFICITKPNGYEGYQAGNNLDIKWKSNVVNVRLEYTSDGGETWQNIVSSTPNDSLYTWVIPAIEKDSFNIRISDAADYSVFDICDNNLTVFTSIIPDNTILTGRLPLEHSPYLINGSVIVPSGDSLIIDPGVVLKFKVDVGSLNVSGKLIAQGTLEQGITFTRQGDEGNWGSITLASEEVNSVLEYCTIQYGQTGIRIYNPKTKLLNSLIHNNLRSGIFTEGASPIISNCIIAYNEHYGLELNYEYEEDTLELVNNTIIGNKKEGIYSRGARCNVVNCIFKDNAATFYIYMDHILISYSIVQEEVLPDFNGSLIIGKDLIYNFDPQFVDLNNFNFHLLPTSPGINQGNPDSGFENEPEENGNRVNLGAYGNTVEATQTDYLPRITWLSAKEGTMLGNDTLRIKGANFLGAKQNGKIMFENSEALEYLYWSNDSLVCISPPHLPETVSIYITNSDLKIGYGVECFTFQTPEIKKLSNTTSKPAGGDTLTIEGDFFGINQEQTILYLGEQLVNEYLNWSDTLITIKTPTNTEGLKQFIFKQDTLTFNSGAYFIYTSDSISELCGTLPDTLKSNHTYFLTCRCEVPEGKTLTIEPGVIIVADFNQTEKTRLTINGKLNALGTQSDSISFISLIPSGDRGDGIYVTDTANFNYVIIKNCEYGIYQTDGVTTIANSHLNNNEIGIYFYAREKWFKSEIANCIVSDNTIGLKAEASNGSATIDIQSSSFEYNEGSGIELYAHGYASGLFTSQKISSIVHLNLTNSIIANNRDHAMYIHSYGFVSNIYSPPAYRYGDVYFHSYNSIIYNNSQGILTDREYDDPRSDVNMAFYNSNFWNNNTVVEMDADEIFFYNSNLWDNNTSGVPTGICDNLVFESCNLNDLSVVQNGNNNISSDPMYVSLETGDFNLQSESPCIDAGSNNFVDFDTDFSDKARIWDGNSDGESVVDIGVFEYGSMPETSPEITLQPQSGSYCLNSQIELSVGATAVPLPEYQWYFNETIINGAEEEIYVIESVDETNVGNYYCTVTNKVGSINSSQAVIELLPSYDVTIYEAICEGDTFVLNSVKYTQSDEIIQSLTTADDCDSIVTTILTVNPVYELEEYVSICEGEDYFGLTGEGEHTREFETVNGCDSIVTTYLTVNPTFRIEENIPICQGESYNGWTTSDTYERILATTADCDSIVTTNLTVHPTYELEENITICEGDSYKEWTNTGEYTENLLSIFGCDSIVTTNLNVSDAYLIEENISICEGENYFDWTTTDIYERTLTSSTGCDSIITTSLVVNPKVETVENIAICQGDTYKGWNTEGQHTETLTSSLNCDSTVVTNLTFYPIFQPNIEAIADTIKTVEKYQTYQWCDINGEIISKNDSIFIVDSSGDYHLIITDDNGCTQTSEVISVIKTGIEKLTVGNFRYTIIPNPSDGLFRLRFDSNIEEELSLKLINSIGQTIEIREVQSPVSQQSEQFDVSHLSKGIYHLVISSEGYQNSEKIVVQ